VCRIAVSLRGPHTTSMFPSRLMQHLERPNALAELAALWSTLALKSSSIPSLSTRFWLVPGRRRDRHLGRFYWPVILTNAVRVKLYAPEESKQRPCILYKFFAHLGCIGTRRSRQPVHVLSLTLWRSCLGNAGRAGRMWQILRRLPSLKRNRRFHVNVISG
jgi:hypothetical protein